MNEKLEILKGIATGYEAGYNFRAMADDEFGYCVVLLWNYDAMKQSGLVTGYQTYNLYTYPTAEEAWKAFIEWQEVVHDFNIERGANKQ